MYSFMGIWAILEELLTPKVMNILRYKKNKNLPSRWTTTTSWVRDKCTIILRHETWDMRHEKWDMRHETWIMRHETWDMRYETWDVWKFRDNICGQHSNIFSKPFFSVIEVDERNQPTKFYLGNISITCFIKVISCGNFVTRYVDDWCIFFHNVFLIW